MSSIESAYFSATLVANGLTQAPHPKAPDALKLKEALAKGVTHPDTLGDEAFRTIWNARAQFCGLNIEGELGETVEKHAQILMQTTL